MAGKVKKTDDEWKKALTPDEYHVLRMKGTERPFTGDILVNRKNGVYVCAGCGNELFSSDTKFDSGSGWPSFYAPIADERLDKRTDRGLFMERTEVVCDKCGGHLGHVFDDGPKPTGLRYCIKGRTAFQRGAN